MNIIFKLFEISNVKNFDYKIPKIKIYRLLFLATNMPYFLPLFAFRNWSSFIVFIVGVVSSIYHTYQYYELETAEITYMTKRFMWIDAVIATILGLYVLFKNKKKINLKISCVIVIALLLHYNTKFANRCEKLHLRYIVLHGIWHIMTSYVGAKMCEPEN